MNLLRPVRWSDLPVDGRAALIGRHGAGVFDPELRAGIAKIFDDVAEHGDEAVCRALRDFDGVQVSPADLRVSPDEMAAAQGQVSAELRDAIETMVANVRRFNEAKKAATAGTWRFEAEDGLVLGEQVSPITSAALFCPSGKASYPSVLAQLGGPAVVAGVPQIVVITPPVPGAADARIDPATLVVAQVLGLDHVVRVNGPAGIAAVTFGTETIPKTMKVVGPGSPAVTVAQLEAQRYGCTSMTLLGPTESVVVADATARIPWLAADLLNEAEHGTDSASVLIALPGLDFDALNAELTAQLAALPDVRAHAARVALGTNGGAYLVDDLAQAAAAVDAYAPEHCQLAVADPSALAARIQHAGELLLGQHTTFSAANFVLGCPASLPTSGFAHVASGITVDAFLKRTAFADANAAALERLTDAVIALAEHEGFPAHANAMRIRRTG